MTTMFTLSDKIRLILRLACLTPWQVAATVLRSFLITRAQGLPTRQYLVCAWIRVVLGTFSPRQIQYLAPPTRIVYETWIQRRLSQAQNHKDSEVTARLRYHVEPLEDGGGSSLLWVGSRESAKKVVLFFHGGGYVAPMMPGHLEWCWRAYVEAGLEVGTEVAVAVLEYTLCPGARFPVQLRQAVSGLSHLLSSGFHEQDIIIGGDSAGGNLTGQLLCHLAHPCSTVRKIELSRALAGAFLVSPWLSRYTTGGSFSDNHRIDMLSGPVVDKSTKELLGYQVTDREQRVSSKLAFPLDMDGSPAPLGGLADITDRIYVTAGSHEVLRDQAVSFVHRVKHLNPQLNVRFDLFESQAHDFILLEGLEERYGESIEGMKTWMKDLLVTCMSSGEAPRYSLGGSTPSKQDGNLGSP